MQIVLNQCVSFCSGNCFIDSLSFFLNSVQKISKKTGVTIQSLNAELIAGFCHIDYAVRKALFAFENKTNTANDIGVEIMRLASGQYQIEKSFSMGLHEGCNQCVFVLIGSTKNSVLEAYGDLSEIATLDPIDTFCDKSDKIKIIEHFGITKEEIDASGIELFEDLVIERVALADFIK